MSETNEILKSLDLISEKINAIESDKNASLESIKSELNEIGKKQHELARELLDIQQKSVSTANESSVDMSIGAQFVKSESYNKLKSDVVNSRSARAIVSRKATPTLSTVSVGVTRDTISVPYQAGIIAEPNLPLLIEGLIPHVPVTTGSVQAVKEKTGTNGAAVVAESERKPESTFGFDLVTNNIATVAHWTKISEQLAADAPAVEAFINAKMMYKLALKIDRQLVTGTGSSSELSGLLNTGNYVDYSSAITLPSDAQLLDFALLIKTKLDTIGYAPRYLLLNPEDWAALILLKDKQGRYILGGPNGANTNTLWGLTVIPSAAVTKGKYVMSDFALGSTIYDRQEMAVEIDRESDDFIKNLFTIRVERRLALVVDSPASVAGGDFTIGS